MATKYILHFFAAFLIISISFFSPLHGSNGSPVPAPAPAPASSELVKELCSRKDNGMNEDFCLEILNSDPRTSSFNASYTTLFAVIMELAMANVTETRNYFYNQSLSKPKLYESFVFCVSRYDAMLKIFRDANDQVVVNKGKNVDMETVGYDLAMADDYAGECRERLFFHGVRDGLLEKMTRDIDEHAEVCEEIAIAMAEISPS